MNPDDYFAREAYRPLLTPILVAPNRIELLFMSLEHSRGNPAWSFIFGASTQNRTEDAYLEGRQFTISIHSHLDPRIGAAPMTPFYKKGIIAV